MKRTDAIAAVAEEVAKEKADALGIAGKALEVALRQLRSFDAGENSAGRTRAELVERAAERALRLIVQREACGLRDSKYVLEFYDVPADVAARLGKGARQNH